MPPCSCPFCRHSSFHERLPLGGHIQCPACLSLSCHQCASRPLFYLVCLPVFSPSGWLRGPRLGTFVLVFWPGCSPHGRTCLSPAAALAAASIAVGAVGRRSERGQGVLCVVLQGVWSGPRRATAAPDRHGRPTAYPELLASLHCLFPFFPLLLACLLPCLIAWLYCCVCSPTCSPSWLPSCLCVLARSL